MRDEDLPAPPGGPAASWTDAQFRLLVEHFPAGAYTCDPQGLITWYNREAVKLWGREPRLNHPQDRFCGSFKLLTAEGQPVDHSQCWMALALANNREYSGQEIVVERPDGTRLNVLANARPVHDAAGKLLGAVNMLVDISQRKQTGEAQAFLAALVESSQDAIVSKTLEGKILSWNAAAEQLFGYTAEEIVGKSIMLLVPPDRQDEERSILERLGQGRRIQHYETVRLSKHGQRIDISLSISPIFDATGHITAVSSVARDITPRKRSEAALMELKDALATQVADLRRLQEMSVRLSTTLELRPILDETLRAATAIEGTSMGLLSLCDRTGKFIHVEASLGFQEEFLKLVEVVPAGGGACGTAFQEGRRVVVEDTEVDPLFEPYREAARIAGFRAVHSTPLITRTGQVIGVLSTHFRRPRRPSEREMHLVDLCARQAVDFIENARLYEQLREADRLKDEFLATLAHELRNPLAPISNSLHLLQLTGDLSPSAERVRDIMQRQVDQMVRLVDDLLEVSRITRGKLEMRKEPVELASIVHSAVETSRPLIEAAGHQLAISLPPAPVMLNADPVRLAQVIANLLNNAAKYTDDGGQIWLSARCEKGQAIISVRDTGVGIPREMLAEVFGMFAQVDRTQQRAQGGLGIGLTLAKRLIELHGGQIEAHSEGPGKGSEFIVRLPQVVAMPPPPLLDPPHQEKSPPLPSRRILVVDDTRAAVFVLGKLLESMGQEVQATHDAVEALEYARSQRPEVVISDIGMPKIDGYELARRLRQEAGLEDVVLVALTGYGQSSDKERARDAGFDFHLTKPVSVEALRELLTSLPAPREAAAK